MTTRRVHWGLAFGAGLLCLLVPACSHTEAKAGRAASAAARPAASRPSAQAAEPRASTPSAAPRKTHAAGRARRHPFAPVVDPQARRAEVATTTGPLALKAILAGDARAALIQEGDQIHQVRAGDRVGHWTVVDIGGDKVVLATRRSKRVLSLYER